MNGKLVFRSGIGPLKDYLLKESLVLGAAPESDLRLLAPGVSRRHAKIVLEGERFWLEDLKSANGTFLNGIGIQRDSLSHLDVITLGRFAELICVLGEASSAEGMGDAIRYAALEPLTEGRAELAIELRRGESTIGRDPSCTIRIDDKLVSRIHARLVRTVDSIALQDLNSSNGTMLNGGRVESVMYLSDGDEICFAGILKYRLKIERAADTDEPSSGSKVLLAQDVGHEWKTRLVWSPDEMEVLAALRAQGYALSDLRKTYMASGSTLTTPALAAASSRPEGARPAQVAKVSLRAKAASSQAAEARAQAIQAVRLVGKTTSFELSKGRHVIGRDPTATVQLDDRGCSRRHAVICIGTEGATIEDLASSNGTFVDGQRIAEQRALRGGETVAFSDTTFRVELLTSTELP